MNTSPNACFSVHSCNAHSQWHALIRYFRSSLLVSQDLRRKVLEHSCWCAFYTVQRYTHFFLSLIPESHTKMFVTVGHQIAHHSEHQDRSFTQTSMINQNSLVRTALSTDWVPTAKKACSTRSPRLPLNKEEEDGQDDKNLLAQITTPFAANSVRTWMHRCSTASTSAHVRHSSDGVPKLRFSGIVPKKRLIRAPSFGNVSLRPVTGRTSLQFPGRRVM